MKTRFLSLSSKRVEHELAVLAAPTSVQFPEVEEIVGAAENAQLDYESAISLI